MVPKYGMPWQRTGIARSRETRSECDIGPPGNDRGEQTRKLSRSIAVVAVEKHDDIWRADMSEAGQASVTISTAGLTNDACAHPRSNLGCAINRVIVNNEDLSNKVRWNIGENVADRQCFITGGDDDRNTHATHHHCEFDRVRASRASIPHVRPARPTTSASDASTGTSSSQIHAVPHSEIHRLARYAHATRAAGRVSSPSTSRMPSEISVAACNGAAI